MENTSKTIEEHATDANTPDWLFASTKAFKGWAVGKEVSRADYDAAVEECGGAKTGSISGS